MGRIFETPCTLEIEQTHDAFHAHLVLDGDIAIGPGDSVQVQGAPIRIAFGEKRVERRMATITRANILKHAWIKLKARFELDELYEVSFTTTRSL